MANIKKLAHADTGGKDYFDASQYHFYYHVGKGPNAQIFEYDYEWHIWMIGGDDWVNGSTGWDYIHGGTGEDHLLGWSGNDELYGEADNDFLSGEQGQDKLYGGDGNDTIEEYGFAHNELSGDAGNDTLRGGDGGDYLFGGADGDLLIGDDTPNASKSGQDNLHGGDGDDTIYAGPSNDNLEGGSGADTLVGDGGFDLAWYGYSKAGVKVDLAKGVGSGGDAQGDTLDQVEGVVGSHFLDVLYGDDGDNELRGLGGSDALFGYGGNDKLRGGDQLDILVGGDDDDTLEGNGGDDQLSGNDGSDRLYGNGGVDTLIGGDSLDHLHGGDGNDVLQGGGGSFYDALWGEGGSDHFKFLKKDSYVGNTYHDTIRDFEVGVDKVDLSEYGVPLTYSESGAKIPYSVVLEHKVVDDAWRTSILITDSKKDIVIDIIDVRYASAGKMSQADLIL